MAQVRQEHGITIVELDKSYDALEEQPIERLSELLLELTGGPEPPQLVLDFSGTEYISSCVLEVLVHVWKRVSDRQGRMVLCCLSTFCTEVVHTTHLDAIWEIEPTLKEALARIRSVESA